mgnify:CR=1 FL=1
MLRVRREKHNAAVKAADDAKIAEEKAANERRTAYEAARDELLSVLDPLLGALTSKPNGTTPQAGWHNSFSEMTRVVDGFAKNLEASDRAILEEAWRKYQSVDRELLKPEMVKLETGSRSPSYARGKALIVPLLESMRAVAR